MTIACIKLYLSPLSTPTNDFFDVILIVVGIPSGVVTPMLAVFGRNQDFQSVQSCLRLNT